jgi:hypothetical protein
MMMFQWDKPHPRLDFLYDVIVRSCPLPHLQSSVCDRTWEAEFLISFVLLLLWYVQPTITDKNC